MSYSLYQTTVSSTEPVSIAEARSYARISDTFEDTLLGNLISAARESAETATHRQIISCTYQLLMDMFPARGFCLPRPPCTQVTEVAYVATVNQDTSYTTIDSTNYHVDTYREPARVIPRDGYVWPNTKIVPNAVRVTFNAGYTSTTIPRSLAQAILLLASHWYENREQVMPGGPAAPMPHAFDRIIQSHRFGDVH